MLKNKIAQRILMFSISVPLITGVIFFLPQEKHLVFNLAVILSSYIATNELIKMLKNKGIVFKSKIIKFLSIPLPLTSYLVVRFNIHDDLFAIVFTSIILFILMISIATKQSKDDFSKNIEFISTSLFVVIYPSYFMSYLIKFSEFQNSSLIILFFILIVYFNDSGAWLIGLLFGKNNRGIVKVSKNKSVMGFFGGTFGTFLFMGLGVHYIPELNAMPLPVYIILSVIISLATIVGDLVESAIKRSSMVKDSGDIIMGRGGLLDSIDSLLLVAPLFYYIVKTYGEGIL